MHGYTCALSARLPVFLGTKVPERNLQNPSTSCLST